MRHTRYPAFTYVPLTNTKPRAAKDMCILWSVRRSLLA